MAGRSWVGRTGAARRRLAPKTRPGRTTTRATRGACLLIRPDSGCEAARQEQESRQCRGKRAKPVDPGADISPA